MAIGSELLEKLSDHLKPKFRMGHFAATKLQVYFHLHILAKELDGMLHFHAQIMRIDFRAELDLFDFVGVLMFFGFFFALGLFVAEFAEIYDAADWRYCIGSDFDQVHATGAGHIQRFAKGHYSELFAIAANYPDFAGTDFPINPDERTGGRRRTWRKRATQDTLAG